jgi:hypothetical protein
VTAGVEAALFAIVCLLLVAVAALLQMAAQARRESTRTDTMTAAWQKGIDEWKSQWSGMPYDLGSGVKLGAAIMRLEERLNAQDKVLAGQNAVLQKLSTAVDGLASSVREHIAWEEHPRGKYRRPADAEPLAERRATPERRIFLAYRRGDSAGHVGRLRDHLARLNAAHVWQDVADIGAGEDWPRAIARAVARSDVMLLVIGPDWLDARLLDPHDQHRREIEIALSCGICIVPVLVQGARLPNEAELPATIVALTRAQAVELRDARWADDVAALAKRLEA